MQVKHGKGVEEIVNHILQAWEVATGKKRHWVNVLSRPSFVGSDCASLQILIDAIVVSVGSALCAWI